MKIRSLFVTVAVAVALLAMPSGSAAQVQPARYAITDLGTLGGAYSFGYGLNNAGVVSGGAATANQTDFVSQTGFLWYRGQMIGVGTLGGSACPGCSSEAGGPNASGLSPVLSETALADPNGEDFCGFGTHRQCLAATWRNGVLTALPTLPGGNNSQAYWANNQGQVIGFSETAVQDPTCGSLTPFQVFQYQAVIWQPNGQIQPLSPVAGDSVAFGFGLNDLGQAVGSSGTCANTGLPPLAPNGTHAVLWQADGTPVDLGNLGGTTNNIAVDVNNEGVVVGNSQYTDGTIHPFIWTSTTGMQDLGAFPGAFLTVAGCCHTLNEQNEVVGFSIDNNGMRAFHWQNGDLEDLNSLVPSDSPWYLLQACSINSAGQIIGAGVINGTVHAYLATPIYGTGTPARGATKPPAFSASVKRFIQQHSH